MSTGSVEAFASLVASFLDLLTGKVVRNIAPLPEEISR
jgi:hypothetical protein